MKKLPEFKTKPIKGVDQKDWGKLTKGYFNIQDSKHAKTDYLLFKPKLINKLAKPFTNTTQMVTYRGENHLQINQAARYIEHKKVDRPEWFDRIEKGNQETKEECLEILLNVSTVEEIYENLNLKRILHRMWNFYGKKKTKKLTPHLNWKRRDWVNPKEDDVYIYNIISKYTTVVEIRNKKVHKTLMTRLQKDKGDKYPKSYGLYLTMKTKNGGEGIRKKRGKYKSKTK